MIAPRLSLVTLGVADVARAEAFYRALGWDVAVSDATDEGDGDFRLFRTQGAYLALYADAALREDAGAAGGGPLPAYRGVALAANLDSPEDVDAALAAAEAAGGRVTKPGHAAGWGGYTGYFADPDGHAWEVAYNPH